MRIAKRGLVGLLITGAAVVVVAAAGVGTAATSNALGVSLTADPGPAEVTKGGSVAFTLVIDSLGTNPWHNVIVTVPAPDVGETKAILKYAVCPPGTTDLSGPLEESSDVGCDLGTVDADETPTVFFVYQMPSSTLTDPCAPQISSCIDVETTVIGQEGTNAPDSPKSKGKEDTFKDAVEVPFLDTPDTNKRQAATYALTECTDPAAPTLTTNAVVGDDNPIVTEVCVPSVPGQLTRPGHTVVINERAHVAGEDVGKTPEVSDICIPALDTTCTPGHNPFSFDDPDTEEIEQATFTFVLWNKSFSGQITKVFEDGQEVSSAVGADPRVLSLQNFPSDGITVAVVKSSDNGGWDFG